MKRKQIVNTAITTNRKSKKMIEQKKTIMVKKQRKIGMGKWDVTLELLQEITSTKGTELIKATFKDIHENRTGEFLIKKEGNHMDMIIDSYFNVGDEEVDLMELIGEKFTINVVEKEGYLNLSIIKAFEEDEDELEIIDEDLEILELEENDELDDFDMDDIVGLEE